VGNEIITVNLSQNVVLDFVVGSTKTIGVIRPRDTFLSRNCEQSEKNSLSVGQISSFIRFL